MRPRCHSARGRRGGYSLIEILVAAVVVAIGFVGATGALCYAAKTSRLAQDTMVAETLAAELVSEVRVEPFGELRSWHTYAGEPGISGLEQECSLRLAESRLPRPQVWLTVTDVQDDLKGISVAVMWGTSSPKGRVSTETLRGPRY